MVVVVEFVVMEIIIVVCFEKVFESFVVSNQR